MSGTLMAGKSLYYRGDTIGLNTIVEYRDQNGVTAKINMKKFVQLAKQCKEKDNIRYFKNWISQIEVGKLAIGCVVIDGLNRLAREFEERVYECMN